jgi:hypothetical protein
MEPAGTLQCAVGMWMRSRLARRGGGEGLLDGRRGRGQAARGARGLLDARLAVCGTRDGGAWGEGSSAHRGQDGRCMGGGAVGALHRRRPAGQALRWAAGFVREVVGEWGRRALVVVVLFSRGELFSDSYFSVICLLIVGDV